MIKKFKISTIALLSITTMLNLGNVGQAYAQNDKNLEDEKANPAVVNVECLNIREGASIEKDIIGQYKLNDEVDLVSIKDGWYKINMEDEKTAWINGEYVTLDGKINVKKLNVRTGPSILDDIIETKSKDEVKILKAYENGWYQIELEDDKVGYVCGKYVDTEAKNLHDYSDLYKVNTQRKSTTSSNSSKKTSYSKNKSSYSSSRTITVSATAYAGHTITATGTRPTVGRTIAVDPNVIPYGTRVYIPALGGTYVAEDCGGGIKGNRIDIFMSSEAKCNAWGVRNIEIQILK